MRRIDVGRYENRVIGQVLREQADHIGDDPFLLMNDERVTFAEANAMANRYGAGFASLGVNQGDVVAFMMDNSIDLVLAALAVNKLGAVWSPTNTVYRGDWLKATFEDGGAHVLVVDAGLLPRVRELGETAGQFKTIVVAGATGHEDPVAGARLVPIEELGSWPGAEPNVDVAPGHLASVTWTSGTTGRSKGVMLLHSAWLAMVEFIDSARDLRDGDCFYCCIPMYSAAGWGLHVFNGMVAGLPVAIDERFSAGSFWDRVRHYGATQLLTLGAMHMFLWQAESRPNDADNPARVAGFIPTPAQLIGPFKERFGLDYIWQAFGQSESNYAMTFPGRSYKENSAGHIRPDLEIRILDDNDFEVPAGQPGEVCVRPRQPDVIFAGYYNRPEATAAAWRNLWYHTGDIGRIDEDGELFFVDRKADYIRYGGRNISSFEVEQVVGAHPAVTEVAAYGIPSSDLAVEDEVKVSIVRCPGAEITPEDIARFVNEHAPYYFVPRYIEFTEELPHTPTGRVEKYLLRQQGVTTRTWDRKAAGFQVQR